MAEETDKKRSDVYKKGGWAFVLVIIASFLLIGLPFLGPFFFLAIPILFVITLPALIWFLYQNKREKHA